MTSTSHAGYLCAIKRKDTADLSCSVLKMSEYYGTEANSCHYLVLPEKRAHAVNGNNGWSMLELEPQHLNGRQQLEHTSGADDSQSPQAPHQHRLADKTKTENQYEYNSRTDAVGIKKNSTKLLYMSTAASRSHVRCHTSNL